MDYLESNKSVCRLVNNFGVQKLHDESEAKQASRLNERPNVHSYDYSEVNVGQSTRSGVG